MNLDCQHNQFIQRTVSAMVNAHTSADLRFNKIESAEDWNKLGRFRRSNYLAKKPYMLSELDDQGIDYLDKSGFVYAASINNEIIASIRLCAFPFETNRYVEKDALQAFLGQNHEDSYLEWTRLLVSPKKLIPNLLNSLIIYAGMHTLATTHYKHYFGYSVPIVRRLFRKFKIADAPLDFSIPHRGEQRYVLFKGSFEDDFDNLFK